MPRDRRRRQPAAGPKGNELLDALKTDHWFWHWGDTTTVEGRFWAPEGMVELDGFMNVETGQLKSFLEELQQDGFELTPAPDNPKILLMDRVKFMEWLIFAMCRPPAYSQYDHDADAERAAKEARKDWVEAQQGFDAEQSRNLEAAEMGAKTAQSGWIRLDLISEKTGIGSENWM